MVSLELWSAEDASILAHVFGVDDGVAHIHKLYEEGSVETIMEAMHATNDGEMGGAFVRAVLLPMIDTNLRTGDSCNYKELARFLERAACCDSFSSLEENTVAAANERLKEIGRQSPRRVCQYIFRPNDIVWMCRTCQSDETCVICNACYLDSDHSGHEVYFYHAQAGGCCDCFPEDDHQLLTDRGFLFYDQLSGNELFAGYDPKKKKIVYEKPVSIIRRPTTYTEAFVSITNQSLSLLTTAGHDIYLSQNKEPHYRKRKAHEILATSREYKTHTFNLLANATNGMTKDVFHTFPGSSSTHKRRIPFLELYGRWLRDGALFCENDTAYLKKCHFVQQRLDCLHIKHKALGPLLYIEDPAIFEYFKRNQILMPWVFELVRDEARAVIRGFACGHDVLRTPSHELRDQFIRLCLHAGYIANFEQVKNTLWQVSFFPKAVKDELQIGAEDIELIPTNGRSVWCATMPHGFVIARRAQRVNGIVISASIPTIQGNCGDADAWNPSGFCTKHGANRRAVLADPLSETPPGLIQSVRRTLRECRRAVLLSSAVSTAAFASGESKSANTNSEDDDEATKTARFASIELARAAGLNETNLDSVLTSMNLQCCLMHQGAITADAAYEHSRSVVRGGEDRHESERSAQLLRRQGGLAATRSVSSALWSHRAKCVVLWLHTLAKCSDALCRLVCETLDLNALSALLRADSRLPKEVASALHALYLTLMADQPFKHVIATAYAQVYESVTADYARGLGLADASLYTLSVQFLNRAIFVSDLVNYHDLLHTLAISLYDTLDAASSGIEITALSRLVEEEGRPTLSFLFGESGTPSSLVGAHRADRSPQEKENQTRSSRSLGDSMQPLMNRSSSSLVSSLEFERFCDTVDARQIVKMDHFILLHRRYAPVIADLKCVLNIDGMAEAFLKNCFGAWLGILSRVHNIDPQIRRSAGQPHVEFENRDWMHAFNVNISLGSIFDCMGSWIRFVSSPEQISLVGELIHSVMDALVRRLPHTVNYDGNIDHAVPSRFRLYAGSLSFHVPLHRFLAHICTEASKSRHLRSVLESLLERLAQNQGIAFAIADESLCALRLASQVRVGLWRRNGHSMNDQLMNYSESPFCRLFRDLDLLVLQLVGLAVSPSAIGFQLLERYDRTSVLSLGITRLQTSIRIENISAEEERMMRERAEERMDDTERIEAGIVLAEEILLNMILLATELPRQPDDDSIEQRAEVDSLQATGVDGGSPGAASSRRIEASTRREVVHRLASGPCTHSEIQECIQLIPKCDQMPAAAFLRIVDQVSIRRPARGIDPEKLELRKECWNEYDGTFFHLTPTAHQQALISMPYTKADTPIVGEPPAEHPCFSRFRRDFLQSGVVLRAVYASLYQAAMHKRAGFHSEGLVIHGLHLLTLAVHCCGDEVLRFAPSNKSAARKALMLESEAPLPCLADLVNALASNSDPEAEQRITSGAAWLSKRGAATHIISTDTQIEKKDSPLSLEQRKRQARERALALMKRKSAAFASVLEQEDKASEAEVNESSQPPDADSALPEVSKSEWVEDYEGATEPYAAVREIAAPANAVVCIVCREAATASRPLGYVGFAQPSCVLIDRPEAQLRGANSATTCDASNPKKCNTSARRRRHENKHSPEGLFVRQCGHALHYDCFDDYFATVVQRSEAHNLAFLDVNAREFQCPLCKVLSNVVVPALPSTELLLAPSSPSVETPSKGESVDSDSEADARCTTAMTSVFLQQQRQQHGESDEIAVCYDQASIDRDIPAIASSPRDEHNNTGLISSLASFVKRGSAMLSVSSPKEMSSYATGPAVTRFCTVLAELNGNSRPNQRALDIATLDPLASAISCTVSNLEAEAFADDDALATLERDLERTARLADALRYAIVIDKKELREELRVALFKSITPINEEYDSILSNTNERSIHDYDDTYAMAVEQDDYAREPQSPSPDLFSTIGSDRRKRHRTGEQRPQVLRPLLRSDCLSLLVIALAIGLDDTTIAQLLRLLALAVSVQSIYIEKSSEEVFEVSSGLLSFPMDVDLFLRRAALVLDCFGRLAVVRREIGHSASSLGTPAFRAPAAMWRAYLGLPSLVALLNDVTIAKLVKRWTVCADSDPTDISLPRPPRSHLIQLPETYSQLHTLINAVENIDDNNDRTINHPAICLVCGQVLSGEGGGHCTRHALECGAGCGIYFLVQECTLLLIHRSRAAYFASPYVDTFGERQGNFRGRPLFLDHDRHRYISKLWANHAVSDAVVQSRFTTRQIIVTGYY